MQLVANKFRLFVHEFVHHSSLRFSFTQLASLITRAETRKFESRHDRRLVKNVHFINASDTIFLIEKVRRRNKKKEFSPFYHAVLCFSEIFGSKANSCLFLSVILLPLPVMSPRHSFPEDARSILGNTSCQFPMLYKVSPYEDRRPLWHTLFVRKSILLREFLYTQVRGKWRMVIPHKKVAFLTFFPVISRSANVD